MNTTTKPSKFAEFDSKLMELIAAGHGTFTKLTVMLKAESEALAGKTADAWRVVDRRLQALRKAGRIASQRAGHLVVWRLA